MSDATDEDSGPRSAITRGVRKCSSLLMRKTRQVVDVLRTVRILVQAGKGKKDIYLVDIVLLIVLEAFLLAFTMLLFG